MRLRDADGTIALTVDEVETMVETHYNAGRMVGVVVTVARLSGTPSFDPGDFALVPVFGASGGYDGGPSGEGDLPELARKACRGNRLLFSTLSTHGARRARFGTYRLRPKVTPLRGCVTFDIGPSDRPTAVGFYDSRPDGGGDPTLLAWWRVTVPRKATG